MKTDNRYLTRGTDPARHSRFCKWLQNAPLTTDETRALQADVDASGGYMVAPTETTAQVLTLLDDLLFIRAKGTVLPPIVADGSSVPVVTDNPDNADWTAEIGTTSFDDAMKTGSRTLQPKMLSKGIKVSSRLLRISEGRAEQAVTSRLAMSVGTSQERGFLIGTGANQPLGLFVASDHGVPTSRDVSTGNTATALTYDGLANALYSLKSQYLARAEWIFHRDAMKALTLLKDGQGQPIYSYASRPGEPDMLLGKPVNLSEHAPHTFTTGLYVGIVGDLSRYHIQDAHPELQRLNEKFAETGQTGFIARAPSDGQPATGEAFARVKLA